MSEYETVPWEDLRVGDQFSDGSVVTGISEWELKPCYTIRSGDGEPVVVSGDHLIQCWIDGAYPEVLFDDELIVGWSTVEHLFRVKSEGSEVLNFDFQELSIEEYLGLEPQGVRCITTSTGQYEVNGIIHHNTTTMAACINDFSRPLGPLDNKVLITLEDPIEYIYESTSTVKIVQKELNRDFYSWDLGIKQSLREHPNFVNVGETRDANTILSLGEASRTGHACVTSFHSSDVGDTLSRMNNALQKESPDAIYDLILNMNMILSQKIRPAGTRFKLNTQYLVFTDQVKQYLLNVLEEGKNIRRAVNDLFKNEELLAKGVAKDWD